MRSHLPSKKYDAVVIGAGPAGSFAARNLALRGWRTLLLEADEFPRWKVCGACLGSSGAKILDDAGLGGMLDRLGAIHLSRTEVCCHGRTTQIDGCGIRVISRSALDYALSNEAVKAGAELRYKAIARVVDAGNHDRLAKVKWIEHGEMHEVIAESVIVACGLNTSRAGVATSGRATKHSLMGLGTTTDELPDWLPKGTLRMVFARYGYVGCVQTERGGTVWAAAVQPGFLRSIASPHEACRRILVHARVEAGALPTVGWRGTPCLTRSLNPGEGRIVRVGDAAGYVEPVTGEGISWALESGSLASHVIDQALVGNRGDIAEQWAQVLKRALRVKRFRCALTAKAVRRPVVTHLFNALMARNPALGQATLRKLIGARSLGERTAR